MQQLTTPILFLIFNRPDSTKQVFDKIKQVKPKQLFIAADGPRVNNLDDIDKCTQTRNFVLSNIDWNCEVKTLLRNENSGCKNAVSQAITWFFDNVEEGIILEDDTIPNESFFLYIEKALKKYRSIEQVMHVTGINFQSNKSNATHKTYLSKYPQIWGWATWKRAWKNYDVSIANWEEFKHSLQFEKWCLNKAEQAYWTKIFDSVYKGTIDTWDYQWIYAIIKNNGLSLVPANNLVTNIGFNTEATHTKIYDKNFADLPSYEYTFSNDENLKVRADKKADEWTFNNIYNTAVHPKTNLPLHKIKNKIKRFSKTFGT